MQGTLLPGQDQRRSVVWTVRRVQILQGQRKMKRKHPDTPYDTNLLRVKEIIWTGIVSFLGDQRQLAVRNRAAAATVSASKLEEIDRPWIWVHTFFVRDRCHRVKRSGRYTRAHTTLFPNLH